MKNIEWDSQLAIDMLAVKKTSRSKQACIKSYLYGKK